MDDKEKENLRKVYEYSKEIYKYTEKMWSDFRKSKWERENRNNNNQNQNQNENNSNDSGNDIGSGGE